MLRLLLGLIRPTAGRAEVFGLDVLREREQILAQVGYLPSESSFYHGMRVGEVLKLSASLRGRECSAEAARLCQRLQLDMARKVDELSFGNRKKVGIVCALQAMPRLLILDEPTSGLDPLMQHAFFDILRERSQAGATIFLSSHVLSEIQRHCDRAAIIRQGQIIACDRVEALARTNAKRVTLQGEAELSHLAGVRDLRQSAQGLSFLYSGDMQALLRTLSAGRVQDVSMTEPDLEEVFLHYYEKEAEGNGTLQA